MTGIESPDLVPKIAVVGATGMGKSSLVNALLVADIQRTGVTPTTRQRADVTASFDSSPVILVDTPGFGEAGRHDEYARCLLDVVAEAQAVVWVFQFPNRALEMDAQLMSLIHDTEPELPILVVGSGIDKVAPRRFDPTSFDPARGVTEDERKAASWNQLLEQTFRSKGAKRVLLCSAGEHATDKKLQYNLRALHDAINQMLPEAARIDFLRRSRVHGSRADKANAIIVASTAAAATAGAIPLPVADAIVITGIQAAMIVSLATVYDRGLSKETAGGLVTAAAAALVGPLLFQQASKFVPFAGSVVGAAVAGAITAAMGAAIHGLLKTGKPLTKEAVVEATKRAYKER